MTFAFAPVDARRTRRWTTLRSSGSGCTRSAGSATSRRSTWAPTPSAPRSTDAGVEWNDVQFAFGGSFEVDNPDAVDQPARPHRHPVHGRLQRLRHRGDRAAADRRRHPLGPVRHRRRGRHGQAPAGRVHRRPASTTACPPWYGENGQFLTTKFFGMKINRYMHDHGISPRDAGQGGGQELPQRRAQPERLPPQADLRGGDPRRRGCSTTR